MVIGVAHEVYGYGVISVAIGYGTAWVRVTVGVGTKLVGGIVAVGVGGVPLTVGLGDGEGAYVGVLVNLNPVPTNFNRTIVVNGLLE